jgi:hypothetical protein
MSILTSIVGLFSPTFRKTEKFRSMLIHPDAKILYEDFLGFCAMQAYCGSDGTETVGNMVERMKSCFGTNVCANIDDFRMLLVAGGWDQSVDEQMEVHPALFEAIAFATEGMHRRILESIRSQEQASAYADNVMEQPDGSDQTAFVASPTNVEPITPEKSVPDFSGLHFSTVAPLTPLTSEDDVVFSSEPPQINEDQYDEIIDRLLHYRNGPGYASIWNNILSDLDPNIPQYAADMHVLFRISQLRHDNRFSVEDADRIRDDFKCYLAGQLPFDFEHEMQLHREEEAKLLEEERLREWQRQNRNDLLTSAAEQQEHITNLIPNALGAIGRIGLSALRTAAVVTVAATVIAKADRDRKNR